MALVEAISGAVAGITNSISGVLGMRQQRLAQESANQVEIERQRTLLNLSKEEYWKQQSGQNYQFAQDIVALEDKRTSVWNTPMGLLLAVGVPALVVLIIVVIIKKAKE